MKTTYPRDGWNGLAFRRLREERGMSRTTCAARTGVVERTLSRYEQNEAYPPAKWRDAAALVLRCRRSFLGVAK